jgi:hypothetical protein
MKKSIFAVWMPIFLGVLPSFGAPINLGSIATKNIAVLGWDSAAPTTSSVLVTASGANFTVSGDVVSNSVQSGLTFTTGSAVTSGTELTNAEADFTSMLTQLGALIYTPVTMTSGGVNNFNVPGNYSFGTGTLATGTVINITGPGQYVFDSTSSINWNGVTVNATGVSNDNVFFYVPTGQTQINNSSVFGDVVQKSAGASILEATAAGTGSLTGRFLSGGFNTSLIATAGAKQSVNAIAGLTVVPEPSTFGLFGLGLGFVAFASRKRKA